MMKGLRVNVALAGTKGPKCDMMRRFARMLPFRTIFEPLVVEKGVLGVEMWPGARKVLPNAS